MSVSTSVESAELNIQRRGNNNQRPHDLPENPPEAPFIAESLKVTALDHIHTYRQLFSAGAGAELIDDGRQIMSSG
jgi:hypothetical protein